MQERSVGLAIPDFLMLSCRLKHFLINSVYIISVHLIKLMQNWLILIYPNHTVWYTGWKGRGWHNFFPFTFSTTTWDWATDCSVPDKRQPTVMNLDGEGSWFQHSILQLVTAWAGCTPMTLLYNWNVKQCKWSGNLTNTSSQGSILDDSKVGIRKKSWWKTRGPC